MMPDSLQWPAGLDTATFLNEYWQKKPLLLPQALPDFTTPLSADELAGLALEEDTTPKLVLRDGNGDYRVEHGPFDSERFATLGNSDWSLLVTDVEKHLPELASYLQPFQFLPSWRIDDLMISYAPDGASVGAHVDAYDVFLLQASGTRHWSIDTRADADRTSRIDGPLQLLAHFHPDTHHELQPGDILYLPPGVPHHGVAVGADCTTWSIGFRAPAQKDILVEFSEMLAERLSDSRFTDPPLIASSPGEINTQSIAKFGELWRQATSLSVEQLTELTGRLITQPPLLDSSDNQSANRDIAEQWNCRSPINCRRHPFSRFAYASDNGEGVNSVNLFVDGIAQACSSFLASQLCSADQPVKIDPADLDENDTATGQSIVGGR